MDNSTSVNNLTLLKRFSVGAPLLMITMLMMIILPIPPFLLDITFSFNIAFSLIILMACVYVARPLNFSIFPTIILVATLLRLTLNVASTRVVLLNGYQGSGAAGEVIRAFGEVVIGRNFVVGIVVFAILVIINFVVVTKGAGRISEVSARFTLDAMPGKQMAIDADLNAGVITQEEARSKREEVTQEADFYGAMDGASKFVRGDAIAGLLILFINLIGGISIGVAQYDMAFTDAMQTFSLLTIGDGLVAQIPSLLLSTAAAIMVTRVTGQHDIGEQTVKQLLSNPRPLIITSAILAFLSVIPGMPHLAFLILAAIVAGGAYMIYHSQQTAETTEEEQTVTEINQEEKSHDKEIDWSDVNPVDLIGLEIGYRLINLVGMKNDGVLMSKIKGIRKKLSQELGFLIAPVHIRDNLELGPDSYRIILRGTTHAEAAIQADKLMAINPGHIQATLDGVPTKDPAFGMQAYWIATNQRQMAENLGFTVVDASTVLATHLNHVLRSHAADLFGHEEAQKLLDRLAETSPKLVESVNNPQSGFPLSVIVKVLKRLLKAQIPITDIRTIIEKLVELAPQTQDADVLTEEVRAALKRLIVNSICGAADEVPVGILHNDLIQIMQRSLPSESDKQRINMINLEPGLTEKLFTKLLEFVQQSEMLSRPAILLVTNELRPIIERLFQGSIPMLHILSHQEMPDDKAINVVATIG
jgi:flagellar biosynthesis protein FlhA